jgi:iron complex outermembrane receptor protein
MRLPAQIIRTLASVALLGSATGAIRPLLAQGSAHVEGHITAAGTGQPLAGINVLVAGARAAVSDENGRYQLSGLEAGAQVLTFRWIGYAPRTESVTLAAGGRATLDVVLSPIEIRLGEVRVTAASRIVERVLDAPAAIVVPAPGRIRETMATGQVPMMVGDLPGVRLSQSTTYDFNLNARGFNTPTNRRLLVLIDGRDPSVPILGNQDWVNVAVTEEASQVEFVRGPGAALYGANAYAGVLSIFTPPVRETPSAKLSLTSGDLQTFRGDVRYSVLPDDARWGLRFNATYQQSQTTDRARTNSGDLGREYAAAGVTSVNAPAPGYEFLPLRGQSKATPLGAPGPVTGAADPVRLGSASVRADYYPSNGSTMTAEVGASRFENAIYPTTGGRAQDQGTTAPWARLAWNGDGFRLLGYYTGRNSESVDLSTSFRAKVTSGTFHVEGQRDGGFAGSRGRYVIGASLRDVQNDTKGTTIKASEDGRSDLYYGAFGQVDYDLTAHLKAVVASRVDQGTLNEAQFSPKLGLVWSVAKDQNLRLTWNRGYLNPSVFQRYLAFPAGAPQDFRALEFGLRASPLGPALLGVPAGTLFTNSAAVPVWAFGNDKLRSEQVTGWEAGYKGQIGEVYVTADVYYSDLSRFCTALHTGVNPAYGPWTAPTAVPDVAKAALAGAVNSTVPGLTRLGDGSTAYVVSFGNAGTAHEYGAEVSGSYRVAKGWTVDGNYSWYNFDLDQSRFVGDTVRSNTPANTANLALTYQSEGGTRVRVAYRFEDAYDFRAQLWHGAMPSAHAVDLNVTWPITRDVSALLSATNLLDEKRFHVYGGSIIGRRALLTLSYRP